LQEFTFQQIEDGVPRPAHSLDLVALQRRRRRNAPVEKRPQIMQILLVVLLQHQLDNEDDTILHLS